MILYVSLFCSLFIDKQLSFPPPPQKNILKFSSQISDINQCILYMYLVSFGKDNNSIFFILEFTIWQRLFTSPLNSNAVDILCGNFAWVLKHKFSFGLLKQNSGKHTKLLFIKLECKGGYGTTQVHIQNLVWNLSDAFYVVLCLDNSLRSVTN